MELFDQVRAAPPPDRIRDTKLPAKDETSSGGGDADEDDDMKDMQMPSPIAATPSPDFTLGKDKDKDKASDDEESGLSGGGPEVSFKTLKRTFSQEAMEVDQLQTDKDKDETNDRPEAEVEDQPQQLSPPKTKAEQKMFMDNQAESTNFPIVSSATPKRSCLVRIKRLSQQEIERHTMRRTPRNKRTRDRRSGQDEENDSDSASSSKKSKQIAKIHIKVPWLKNGAKHRALQKLARDHTPPPNKLNKLSKGIGTPKNHPTVSAAMIRRYGKRFFGCVVRIKRFSMSWSAHSAIPLSNNSSNSAKRRSRKSNLSVSFSEAVEIFGSSESSGTRRSTLGSGRSPRKGCVTVPTRLQRVDATGNILEDISLTSNDVLCESNASKKSRSSSDGNNINELCNGGDSSSTKSIRASPRVPVSGLASLHLEDKCKSNANADADEEHETDHDDDDEYIVPNELPGTHRAGTPIATLLKRKFAITTTTISDEDDDDDKEEGEEISEPQTQEKEQKILREKKDEGKEEKKKEREEQENEKVEIEEQIKEEVIELKEKGEEKKLKERIEREEAKEIDAEHTKKEEHETKVKTEEKIKEEKKQEDEKEAVGIESDKEEEEVEMEEKEQENTTEETAQISETEIETVKETESEPLIGDTHANPKATQFDEGEEASRDVESHMESLLVSQTDLSETDDHTDQQFAKDNGRKLTSMDLKSKASPMFFLNSNKHEDDILEIETSFDDVRDLHTPLSNNSRCSTPQAKGLTIKPVQPLRTRLDSADSDSSFKSATELVVTATIPANITSLTHPASDTNTTNATAPATSLLNNPPAATSSNNSEPPSGSTADLLSQPFPAIGVIPSLDVLDHLTEPDFQLNSSRHTIATGALDDIMTALES